MPNDNRLFLFLLLSLMNNMAGKMGHLRLISGSEWSNACEAVYANFLGIYLKFATDGWEAYRSPNGFSILSD